MNDRFVVRTQPYRIENQMVFHNFQEAKDFYYQIDKKGKGVQLLYQFITPQGQYEEHLWKDNRNPLEGSFTFDAENFGGDPEGKLAKALERARKKAKQPRKPLKIERLKAESFNGEVYENAGSLNVNESFEGLSNMRFVSFPQYTDELFDSSMYWESDDGNARGIMSYDAEVIQIPNFEISKKVRNTGKAREYLLEMIENAKEEYGGDFEIQVIDVDKRAEGFWQKMLDEKIIDGWNKGSYSESFGVETFNAEDKKVKSKKVSILYDTDANYGTTILGVFPTFEDGERALTQFFQAALKERFNDMEGEEKLISFSEGKKKFNWEEKLQDGRMGQLQHISFEHPQFEETNTINLLEFELENFNPTENYSVRAESFGAEHEANLELIPYVYVEGIGIMSGDNAREHAPRPIVWDGYTVVDGSDGHELLDIPADGSPPLQDGEIDLIESMIYGFYHPQINDGMGEFNVRGMFWTIQVMELLANYDPADYQSESFGAEAPSYMADSDAHKLMEASWRINSFVESTEEYPQWWKSRLSVAASNVDDLADYLDYAMSDDYDAESFEAEGGEFMYHVYISDYSNSVGFIDDSNRDFENKSDAKRAAKRVAKNEGKGKWVLVVAEVPWFGIEEIIYEITPDGDVYGADTFNAEDEQYFVFADGKTMMELEDYDNAIYLQWKIPYSQIRDYVNEWTDSLKSDQEWRLGDGPYHVAYDFAHGKSAPDIFTEPFGEEFQPPYTMEWAKEIEDAVKSRIWMLSDNYTDTVDLDEPMTKAEIRSFLTGIPSWRKEIAKRAENRSLAKRSWDALNNVETAVGTVGLAHMIGLGAIFGGGLAFLKGRKSNSKTEK